MARRYYRRTRVVRPKKKWATNFKTGSLTAANPITLVENTAQSTSPTPVILKAGNFKAQVDIAFVPGSEMGTGHPRYQIFIYYLPEGVAISVGDLVTKHPEWVIGWKQLDSVYGGPNTPIYNANSVSFSSRLKRNLNSGDKIMIGLYEAYNPGVNVSCQYSVQYWTCSN